MRIAFYSSNPNKYDFQSDERTRFPTFFSEWEVILRRFSEYEFFVISQLPSPFLLDLHDGIVSPLPSKVNFKISSALTPADFAKDVLAFKIDIAIAASFWLPPFDWHCLFDSEVAEILRINGVKTLSHPSTTSFLCFDKYQTRLFLEKNDFSVPRAVFVDHRLYWAERGKKEINVNVYKNYILRQIQDLRFPVVIKDTAGLSSYGMEVAVSFAQALDYLNSGRTNSDRIVEEYKNGVHFGTEIFAENGNYYVLPPLVFSLNKFGITSPKQSVKLGTVNLTDFDYFKLNSMLIRLSKLLNFSGIAQVDLVFCNGEWHIIEINPRLSGMTETNAALLNKSVLEILLELALGIFEFSLENFTKNYVCNLKLPLLSDSKLKSLYEQKNVALVRRTQNPSAKQEREKGFCEMILKAPP